MQTLLISGVDVTTMRKSDDRPMPDYVVMRQCLSPDVIDVSSIAGIEDPVASLAHRLAGAQWAIAVSAFRRRKKYSVILATGEDVGFPLAFLMKYFGGSTPLIVTCHNISSRRPSFFLRRLGVGSAVSVFQCLSASQAAILATKTRLNASNKQLLFWHVDHEFFRPMPEVPEDNIICSAGMASRDYATLLAATSGMEVDVKIAADSPWFKQTLNVDTTTLAANVEVRSYGTYSALRDLYAKSRVVVVPLIDVPYSAGYTVMLEAMAMAKPLIVTRTRQPSDFIVDGVNAVYVPPNDPAALREKLEYLLSNPEYAKQLGRSARKTVEEGLTLRHYVGRVRSAVEQALKPREE